MSEFTGEPDGYLITFRTYGTWLHGDERGSVDRLHRRFMSDYCEQNAQREMQMRDRMPGDPIVLTTEQRRCVDATIRRVCNHKAWHVHELNVRTNHVHLVVTADFLPEPLMNSLKSWATRDLRDYKLLSTNVHPWARHGSTVYLWSPEDLVDACIYVRDRQD